MAVIGAPEHYRELLEPLPAALTFSVRLDQTTDITENTIRELALPMGLVEWSGLKLVVRKALR